MLHLHFISFEISLSLSLSLSSKLYLFGASALPLTWEKLRKFNFTSWVS
jgi:hypothetical protein